MRLNNVETFYPLSPLQEGMLFHALSDPASSAYTERMSCSLVGPLNAQAFRSAWQEALNRHPILRTGFVWEGMDKPVQVAYQRVDLPFDFHDLRALSAPDRGRRIRELLEAHSAQSFDLIKPPLMRLLLIRAGDRLFEFVWTFHHILLDGWSVSKVIQEVSYLYDNACQGIKSEIESCRPFKDYIGWLKRQDMARAEAFWRRALKGFAAPTQLGIYRTQASSVVKEHANCLSEISDSLTQSLHSFARQQQVTLNTILQGAWAVLLRCYSGETDVLFGMTVSGRPADLAGVESMVGLFINTLPLRVNVNKREPVALWLRKLQSTQSEMRQFEYSPLAQVQGWSEAPRGYRLFDSILVFENYPRNFSLSENEQAVAVSNLRWSEGTNYPLAIVAIPGERLALNIIYDPESFESAAIERLAHHLESLLEQMVNQPEAAIETLTPLTAFERRQILEDWSGSRNCSPQRESVPALFKRQVEQRPDAIALACEQEQVSYAELNRKSNQLAHHLVARGVSVEDVVGICLNRSVDLLTAFLGVAKSGAAYLPIDPAYPRQRLQYMLSDSEAKALISQSQFADNLRGFEGETIYVDADSDLLAGNSIDDIESGVEAENALYVMYTSGSTGEPKGALIEHRNVVRLVKNPSFVTLGPEDTLLQLATVCFDASTLEIWGALLNGAKLIIAPAETPSLDELSTLLDERGVTTLWLTSGLFHLMVDEKPDSFSKLRQMVAGGDVLSARHVRSFLQRNAGCVFVNGYGPTENTTFTCCHTMRKAEEVMDSVLIGRPINNTTVYVLDERMQPAPEAVAGELYTGGEGLARRYVADAMKTAEKFAPNPYSERGGERLYRTGDIARFRRGGEIEFLGRADTQVKVRGFRIELAEIEAILNQHPSVKESVVTLREAAPIRMLAGYVTYHTGFKVEADELRSYLRDRLPEFMVPSAFVFMDELPLNASGKVDRRSLPAPELSSIRQEQERSKPESEMEQRLLQIWSQVFKTQSIGALDNFFELGGDSILSIQVAARANQAGIRISSRDIFLNPTLFQLASVASTRNSADDSQETVTGLVPLTPIQRWFFDHYTVEPSRFNHAVMLEAREPISSNAMREAVRGLAAHHDMLRARFIKQDESYIQRIEAQESEEVFVKIDLKLVSRQRRRAAIEAAAGQAQGSLNLSEGPMLRVAEIELGGGERRLLIAAHHLVVDVVSWGILLEDIERGYRQAARGEKVDLGNKSASFKRWAERLEEESKSEEVEKERRKRKEEKRKRETRLAVEKGGGKNQEDSSRAVEVRLSREETEELMKGAQKAFGIGVEEAVVAGVSEGLNKWSGMETVKLEMEGHGREWEGEEIDVSRTVGWFTEVYEVEIEAREGRGIGEVAREVKRKLRESKKRGRRNGLMKGEGERLIGEGAEIGVNYLGQVDKVIEGSQMFALARESCGPTQSGLEMRKYLLEISAMIMEGHLRLILYYSDQNYNQTTIETLAGHIEESLRNFEARCKSRDAGAYAMSDSARVGLSESQLEKAFQEVEFDG
jgi:amino acid adenylation domain-containing protein/non-ribosomal peptide synthase protein (TIGR01720 family)